MSIAFCAYMPVILVILIFFISLHYVVNFFSMFNLHFVNIG